MENVKQFAAAMGEVVDAAARKPGRSARVATLAEAIAGGLGVSTRERGAIRVAALLMDIGQLGVPRFIVKKPDVLTVREMELVRHHPGWAAPIIDSVPALEQIARGWRPTTIAPMAVDTANSSHATKSRSGLAS